MSESTTWIEFGIIGRAHGVRGELRVVPHDAETPLPEAVKVVRARSPRAGERLLTLKAVRRTHGALLVTFEEVVDRDAAQDLGGAALDIELAALPPLEEDEVYVFELEGAEVQDEAGVSLGKVRRVVGNREQDVLEIDSPAGERLLPLVPEMLAGFDRERRVLTVRPVAGLWE